MNVKAHLKFIQDSISQFLYQIINLQQGFKRFYPNNLLQTSKTKPFSQNLTLYYKNYSLKKDILQASK